MKIKSMEWILHCNMSDTFDSLPKNFWMSCDWIDMKSMLFGTEVALNILSWKKEENIYSSIGII